MIEVALLGRVAVTVDGQLLAGEAAQRRRVALIALLCVPTVRPLSRDRLMLYLWPESGAESARHLLSVAVHVLRKALGHEALLTPGDEVALAPGAARVDVGAFEDALHAGDFEGAIALYGGPFMDGFHAGAGPELEQWVEEERTRLQREYAQALEGAATARRASGDASGAVEAWRRLAALDPYASHGALGLMRALAEAGNRAAAIRQAAVHRQLLEGELGVGPDPEVEALAEALRSEPAAPPAPIRTPTRAAAVGKATAPSPAPGETAAESSPPPRDVELAVVSPGPVAPRAGGAGIGTPGGALAADVRGSVGESLRPWQRALRHWQGVAVALVLVALAAFVAARWLSSREAPRTLAVLVLRNVGQPDSLNHGEGISDDILSRLEGVEGVRVMSRSFSRALGGDRVDVREIGRKYDVGYVVDGTYQIFRDRIRVNVELSETRNGHRIWQLSFERPQEDIFAIQDTIAQAVVDKLTGRRAPARETHVPSLAAYDLYRQGRAAWYQRTPESLAAAARYFERAVAQDSNYAQAYAGLAETLIVQGSYDYGTIRPDSAYPRAQAAAARAIRLDPGLASAHAALASIYMDYDWNLERAEREFRRAIDLNPGYSPAREWYSLLLMAQGRVNEAFRQIQRAGETELLSPAQFVQRGHYFYYRRQFDQAAKELEEALRLDPGFARAHLLLALTDIQRGRAPEAVRRMEMLRSRAPEPPVMAVLGYAYASAGRRLQALACRDSLAAASRRRYVPAELLVLVDVGLNDHARALAGLEEVRRLRSDGMIYLAVEPAMDPLRREPRFAALVRAVAADTIAHPGLVRRVITGR